MGVSLGVVGVVVVWLRYVLSCRKRLLDLLFRAFLLLLGLPSCWLTCASRGYLHSLTSELSFVSLVLMESSSFLVSCNFLVSTNLLYLFFLAG